MGNDVNKGTGLPTNATTSKILEQFYLDHSLTGLNSFAISYSDYLKEYSLNIANSNQSHITHRSSLLLSTPVIA